MTTNTSSRAASTFPVAASGPAGDLKVAWGTYAVAANPTAGDVFEMHWVPDGATVVGGWYMAEDLDTNATATIDNDVGWAANNSDAANSAGFGNFGVQTGDVSVHLPVAGVYLPYQGVIASAGPKTFTAGGGATKVQVTSVAAAATFSAGQITCVSLYTAQ